VPTIPDSITEVSRRLRSALESADLDAIAALLAPNVTWGPPGAKSPPCRSKQQVLEWYQRGKFNGALARVVELDVIGNRIVVGLVVLTVGDAEQSDPVTRWQVFTVDDGHVSDIVGFDTKSEAHDWIVQG
jgi:SnoaL-like domain